MNCVSPAVSDKTCLGRKGVTVGFVALRSSAINGKHDESDRNRSGVKLTTLVYLLKLLYVDSPETVLFCPLYVFMHFSVNFARDHAP